MAHHETALAAIYEDALSDRDFEEGEIEEDEQGVPECRPMDVDPVDGQCSSAEEGELVQDELPNGAFFLDNPVQLGDPEVGTIDTAATNGDAAPRQGVVRPPKQKKPKKKRSGKRVKSVNVAQFVREACKRLQENKYPLVWAAVKNLGVDAVKNLLKEVDVIEKCGGQMTNDGKRRRTPGGVMWNILRGRVQPNVYKEIMSQGNEVQKQKIKEVKESLKRNRMDVDEPVANKRQKLTVNEPGPVVLGKQVGRFRKKLRPVKKLLDVTDGPQRDDSLPPAIQLQKAWAEGVRKKENVGEASVVVSVNSHPGFDLGGSGMESLTPVLLEKISVPVHERLRVPVEYSDLIKQRSPKPSPERYLQPTDNTDLVDGGGGEM